MSIVVVGVPAFTEALAKHVVAMTFGVNAAVGNAAHLVEAEVKKTLTTTSHKKRTPTPSQPGEPPSLVTGRLRRSVKVKITERASASSPIASAQVGPTAIYGRIQELGGVTGAHGSVLPARPYLAPTLQMLESSGRLRAVYEEAWLRALEGLGAL